MPSTSAKQAKFMRAVAHSPKFAKKVGVKQSVGKDFEMADKKMKKFGKGGMPKESTTGSSTTTPSTSEAAKQRKAFEDQMRKQNQQAQDAGKREGRAAPGHKAGGKIMKKATKFGAAMKNKSADAKGRAMKMAKGGKCYAGGGLVGGHKSADGIAKRGKTKGMKV